MDLLSWALSHLSNAAILEDDNPTDYGLHFPLAANRRCRDAVLEETGDCPIIARRWFLRTHGADLDYRLSSRHLRVLPRD
ncbi:hypothetical protein SBA5_360003 [Candidatus Sulfotelmatomonas gaucii]|uniref:Uncharacterized protein n=1 Tax=Candidatus Sulfuritelmatomonas gaucii TaxID=2043161 RepID=A0A2N9LIB5_9BACT|nr:hypothetical protein SBA5_360003 [Candidatus Sulfotelmatomonas gaucii]